MNFQEDFEARTVENGHFAPTFLLTLKIANFRHQTAPSCQLRSNVPQTGPLHVHGRPYLPAVTFHRPTTSLTLCNHLNSLHHALSVHHASEVLGFDSVLQSPTNGNVQASKVHVEITKNDKTARKGSVAGNHARPRQLVACAVLFVLPQTGLCDQTARVLFIGLSLNAPSIPYGGLAGPDIR